MEQADLERLSFFDGLPGWALARLAEAAREEELPAGRTVLHQHDRTRTVHLLLAGAGWPWRPTALFALTVAAAIGVGLIPAVAARRDRR